MQERLELEWGRQIVDGDIGRRSLLCRTSESIGGRAPRNLQLHPLLAIVIAKVATVMLSSFVDRDPSVHSKSGLYDVCGPCAVVYVYKQGPRHDT